MNTVLVTGGSGFLGCHLVQGLLKERPAIRVRTISRNEQAIRRMLDECHSERLAPFVGDIRDIESLKPAVKGSDTVIHLAAMKHVDLGETHPVETIMTGVIGTKNLLDLFSGDTFLGMSTDKAVEAITCYGATKLLTEKLILNRANGNKRCMVVRAGNLFGSTGSVIGKWRQQIAQANEIIITDPDMTRFFIDVDALVDFIIATVEQGESGKVYIPNQKALKLADLAQATIECYGNRATRLKVDGRRAGEKPHEVLFFEGEGVVSYLDSRRSEEMPRLTVEEIKCWLKKLDKQSV